MNINFSLLILFLTTAKVYSTSNNFFKGKFWNGRVIDDVLGLGNANNLQISDTIQTKWFNQRLDHFNPKNNLTWKQLYYVNDAYYKPGGPVFLQIGGEGAASKGFMLAGELIDLAQEHKALCLMLEHRYYGSSHPTVNMSTANLRWLSSEQALADVAMFITAINQERKLTTAKWVTFGGSYPGSLSAWARLKYPHLIHTAVSSSAPLLAIMNFDDYLGVVRDSLNSVDPLCIASIAQGTAMLQRMLAQNKAMADIKQMFMLCDDIDVKNVLDIETLFNSLAGNFMGIVQYNKDNRGSNNVTIETLCTLMGGEPLLGLAAVNKLILQQSKSKCLDFKYANAIKTLRDVNWNTTITAVGMRQWSYQTCTEFGFFQTSDLKNQPFGHNFPLSYSLKQCMDAFGAEFNTQLLAHGILKTNSFYGGKNITASRIIFVNGSIDPWHKLGLTTGPVGNNAIVYIEGTAHCANMYPASAKDSPQLQEARIAVANSLRAFLAQS